MKDIEKFFYIGGLLSLLCGGVLWLASIDSKASIAVSGFQDMRQAAEQDRKALEEIRLHLAHIDDALNN